ncbi:hypothetical protein MRX96_025542 [Rhipicephalus microplus]
MHGDCRQVAREPLIIYGGFLPAASLVLLPSGAGRRCGRSQRDSATGLEVTGGQDHEMQASNPPHVWLPGDDRYCCTRGSCNATKTCTHSFTFEQSQ